MHDRLLVPAKLGASRMSLLHYAFTSLTILIVYYAIVQGFAALVRKFKYRRHEMTKHTQCDQSGEVFPRSRNFYPLGLMGGMAIIRIFEQGSHTRPEWFPWVGVIGLLMLALSHGVYLEAERFRATKDSMTQHRETGHNGGSS